MIFRVSQKLGTKIKTGKLDVLPKTEDPLLDWSCHVFPIGRTQHIIVCNTQSLYCCLLPGKGITDKETFLRKVTSSLQQFLILDEFPEIAARLDPREDNKPQFSKALNRSITGSMNDFINCTKISAKVKDFSLEELSRRLNDMPMSALDKLTTKPGFGFPRHIFEQSLASKNSRKTP